MRRTDRGTGWMDGRMDEWTEGRMNGTEGSGQWGVGEQGNGAWGNQTTRAPGHQGMGNA